ncbi:hypothetical protein F3Y22_tig00109925pilonHSYRG00011 [Hibiscus syriacus]|uniref:DUF4283 domain-containing protein n=1 Tax=Hibiscus syriacus TaxID=106335 RepID=A0A6A3BWK9_HIBSY|nr:hypothetical protein F3Y22_tig00109925pilonHSYRG00011 [Hibiscus syriacus]
MENPCENSAPPLREYCNPPPPVFVPPAPPPIGSNLAGNQHGIEVLSSLPLERPGSPFPDEDQRVTKKEKRSYASAVTSQLKQTTDVVSLQAMDEVVVLDGECIVDINVQYPVIQFADQVHDRIDYSMRRSLQGQYQVIDLENDYFLVKFESEQGYIHVLMEGPWMIFGCYLTVQPWSLREERHGSSFDLDKGLGCEESGFGPWMITETREGNNGIDEDSTVIPEVAVDVTNMEKGLANTSRIDSRVKGKSTRPTKKTKEIRTLQQVDKERPSNGLMESGASRLGYPGRSGKTEAIQTLQQINVIAMKDEDIPQVTEHGNVRAVEWKRGRKSACSGSVEAVTEEGADSPSFRRYLREHRPGIVALLETRISGNVTENAIRTFGFQNSFRVEALGFSGVYASPQVEKHKLVWKHLINLDPGGNEAWVLGGDFTSILRLDERDEGSCRGS